MKISIFGTGYVGLVTWACLAELGHDILCIDTNKIKVENLENGIIPIYELGLEEIVKRNHKNGRLKFSTSTKDWIEFWKAIFNAVWTPPDKENQEKADLCFVDEVAKSFGRFLSEYKILINKSTVPVWTAKRCKGHILKELKSRNISIEFDVISNPEFLREWTAVKDFLLPERIVCWISSQKAKELMEEVYKPITRSYSHIFFTSVESAELIKYAANTFLAVKISFINEIANFAELVWANIEEVAKWIGLDSRIGKRFLHAGIGYGWSCFPKDVKALIESWNELGFEFQIPQAAEKINKSQKYKIIEKIEKIESLRWKTITIWGLAFKPKTDDVREAPSISLVNSLLWKQVQQIHLYDPVAENNFKNIFPESEEIKYFDDMYESLKNADFLVIVTEWDEFRIANLEKIKEKMQGNIIADGRNIWERDEVEKCWLRYIGIGK